MIIDINITNLHGIYPVKLNHIFMDGKIFLCFIFYNRSFCVRYYVHPDSPQIGSQWMKQSILFNKVKITNSPMQNPNHVNIFFLN